MRHNQEIACHQPLYILVIFIYQHKDVMKFFNWQIYFINRIYRYSESCRITRPVGGPWRQFGMRLIYKA